MCAQVEDRFLLPLRERVQIANRLRLPLRELLQVAIEAGDDRDRLLDLRSVFLSMLDETLQLAPIAEFDFSEALLQAQLQALKRDGGELLHGIGCGARSREAVERCQGRLCSHLRPLKPWDETA